MKRRLDLTEDLNRLRGQITRLSRQVSIRQQAAENKTYRLNFIVARRRRQRPRASQSRYCSTAARGGEPTNLAGWLDARRHRLLLTRGAATAALRKPAYCFGDGAVGQPMTASPTSHRDRNAPSRLHLQKRHCRPSAKKIAVRRTFDASWTVSKLHPEHDYAGFWPEMRKRWRGLDIGPDD
jgi:hypothetical protein